MQQLRDHGRWRAPGPVGILTTQCAKFRGAARVILIDEHAYRLVRPCARPACQSRPLPRAPAHTPGLAPILKCRMLALDLLLTHHMRAPPLSFRTQ